MRCKFAAQPGKGGEQSVPRYQCYVLTHDLRVAREKDFEAAGNAEALKKGRLVVSGQGLCHAFELWHGDHRVGGDFDKTVRPSSL